MFCVCAPSTYHFAAKPTRDDDSRFWRCVTFLFLLAAFPAAVGFIMRFTFLVMFLSGFFYALECLAKASYHMIKQCCRCPGLSKASQQGGTDNAAAEGRSCGGSEQAAA